jgi:hypothetical protein
MDAALELQAILAVLQRDAARIAIGIVGSCKRPLPELRWHLVRRRWRLANVFVDDVHKL